MLSETDWKRPIMGGGNSVRRLKRKTRQKTTVIQTSLVRVEIDSFESYLDWRPDTSLEIGGMWEVKGKNSDTRNPGFHLRQWANGSERKQFKATAKKYGHTIAEKKKLSRFITKQC